MSLEIPNEKQPRTPADEGRFRLIEVSAEVFPAVLTSLWGGPVEFLWNLPADAECDRWAHDFERGIVRLRVASREFEVVRPACQIPTHCVNVRRPEPVEEPRLPIPGVPLIVGMHALAENGRKRPDGITPQIADDVAYGSNHSIRSFLDETIARGEGLTYSERIDVIDDGFVEHNGEKWAKVKPGNNLWIHLRRIPVAATESKEATE